MAAFLRLYELGGPSLTVDEGMSAFEAFLYPKTPWDIPSVMREIREVHPPGYFLLLHFWSLAGTSEAWLRLSSALPGILAVPLTLWLSVELRGRLGVGAGLLLATSAWHVQYSRELRMYPLLGVLVLVELAAFLRYARTGRKGWLALSALAAGGAFWVHYFGLFGPLLTGVWVLRNRRDRVVAWLVSTLVAWLLFVPWLPTLAGQFGAQNLQLREQPGWLALPELLGRMTTADLFPSGWPGYLGFSLIPLVLMGIAVRGRRALDPLLWLLIPPLVAWAVSHFTPLRVFEFKYFYWCAPFLALVEGEVLESAWGRAVLAVLVLLNLACWGLLTFHPRAANQDWRAVAAEIQREAPAEGGVVLVQPSMMAAPLLYYGVPSERMSPLDVPTTERLQEALRGRWSVWLVTTPHHPMVTGTGLEAALDSTLTRERARQRPDEGAWLPSAVTRVVRYRNLR